MAGALDPKLTDFQAIEKKIERALKGNQGAEPAAIAASALQRVLTGPYPEARLFTADEVHAIVTAVASAERDVSGATVMAHVQAKGKIEPDTATAIREIVMAAYVEMLVGE